MKPETPANGYFLKSTRDGSGGKRPDGTPEERAEAQTEEEEDDFIICRQCSQIVTHPTERMAADGSHQHTFANPHGIVYDIACFRSANGCAYTGPATGEFTWFRGYQWRIAVCRSCLTHLGWLFTSTSGDYFHGLILDRLKQPD